MENDDEIDVLVPCLPLFPSVVVEKRPLVN